MESEVKKTFAVVRLQGQLQIWDGPDFHNLLKMLRGELIKECASNLEAMDLVQNLIDGRELIGSIYVGEPETTSIYRVQIEMLTGTLPAHHQRKGKASARLTSDDPGFSRLLNLPSPLWLGLDGEHNRYQVTIFADNTARISWDWDTSANSTLAEAATS